MLPNRQLTPIDFGLMFWRHKWLLVLSVIIVLSGAVAYCLVARPVYRGSIQVVVEALQIPESYIQSIVPAPLQDLNISTQEITSKPWLQRVVRELKLFDNQQDPAATDLFFEKMHRNIQVSILRQGEGKLKSTGVISISYAGEDRHTVEQVINKLSDMFIENTITFRRKYTAQTTAFLTLELKASRTKIESQEQKINDFKKKYMGELPEQHEANLKTLDRLQEQLKAVSEALEGVRNRKSVLRQERRFPQSVKSDDLVKIEKDALNKQIVERRLALASLQQTFTKEYPDLANLQEEIAALEIRLVAIHAAPQENQPLQPAEDITPGSTAWQFQEELGEIERQEAMLLKQQAAIEQQIAVFEERVANTPEREQMLLRLTQDYKNALGEYNSLQQRAHNATLSANLEKQQEGEQFKVLGSARVPFVPEAPNRRTILMMGSALGLAIGCGMVWLAEQRDRSFRDPEDFNLFTALPVFATIPHLMTTVERRRRRWKKVLVVFAYMLILVAPIASVHYFWMPIELVLARPLQQFTIYYDVKDEPDKGFILYFGFDDKPNRDFLSHPGDLL